MSRGPDAETLLLRALAADALRYGCAIDVIASDWTRWASATFVGARHVVTLSIAEIGDVDGWVEGLAEANLPLRNHLVADMAVEKVRRTAGGRCVELQALTVECQA